MLTAKSRITAPIANGFPMAAIVGRASVMDAAQETFVSSTAWTERVGPVAALATLRKHREQNVARHAELLLDRRQRAAVFRGQFLSALSQARNVALLYVVRWRLHELRLPAGGRALSARQIEVRQGEVRLNGVRCRIEGPA